MTTELRSGKWRVTSDIQLCSNEKVLLSDTASTYNEKYLFARQHKRLIRSISWLMFVICSCFCTENNNADHWPMIRYPMKKEI